MATASVGAVPSGRRGRRLVLALALALVASGCSTYADRATAIRARASTGDLAGALALVPEPDAGAPDVLDLLDRGLLLFYEGRHEEAAAHFDRAQARIDDLYTKSVSAEAMAFLTNDATLPYTGYPGEQVLLHTYASLAHLSRGDLQSALVESRRASGRLQILEAARADKKGYTDDAFAEWISAMLYAQDGDANACMVASRRALAAFEEAQSLWGQAIPADFVRDHVLWARRFGFDEEAVALEDRFGALATDARPLLPDEGEILLIYESGWVDALREVRVDYPILEGDRVRNDDEYARDVHRRGRRGDYSAREDVRIRYWLSVAVPEIVRVPHRWTRARVRAADLAAHTEPVHDVSAIFRLTYEEGGGKRMVRTILRGVAKYLAVEAAGKKNEFSRFAANVFASASERADTRSWSTLPDRIHLARIALPAGEHDVVVELLDDRGEVGRTLEFAGVPVRAGERTVLHHRSFR